MSKLFIFGIGGTGSRVIKSLTMLLASGVQIKSTEIIPIIVDPDRANGDMNRTVDMLRQYQRVRKAGFSNETGFFHTKITTLNELVAEKSKETIKSEDFRFELEGVQNERFKDFIDYANLDPANKSLTSLLFSEENLDADMEVGFKGNPNIGSVVLNQFKDSDEFKYFSSNFEENDRIFIISSIFGGTGAAGFPLILKNIRNASDKLSNPLHLRNAKIGAITLLPYFGVAPDEKSKIDKATFISKSKAALSYYQRNVSGNNSLNALYYIGDKETRDYDNVEGAMEQKNDAHFIEMAAALAVVDFSNTPDDNLQTINGKATAPVYKEFGVKEYDVNGINFTHLGANTYQLIAKRLSQYMYLTLFLQQEIRSALNKHPWSNAGKVKIDNNFISSPFYSDHLTNFNKHFNDWLTELERNKVAFHPFNRQVSDKNIFQLLNGVEKVKSFNPLAKNNYELYISQLNKAHEQVGDLPTEQKFLAIFWKATEGILKEKFNLN
jgi:hypothetical protein